MGTILAITAFPALVIGVLAWNLRVACTVFVLTWVGLIGLFVYRGLNPSEPQTTYARQPAAQQCIDHWTGKPVACQNNPSR